MVERSNNLELIKEIKQKSGYKAAQTLEEEGDRASAGVLSELDPRHAAEILENMDKEDIPDIVALMAPDDAADIVSYLDHSLAIGLLSGLEEEHSEKILGLLNYSPTTAGGIMTTDFVSMRGDATVGEAIDEAKDSPRDVETIYYIYVTDINGRIEGIASLRDLLSSNRDRNLSTVMKRDIKTLPSDMDQEEVARVFDSHNYQAMPVVEEGKIKGIITFDDVIDVMREESTEDLQKMAGLLDHETVFSSWHHKVSKRLPWLYLNLVAAFIAAGVVSYFEGTLAQITILAAFLPVINNQAGNTGMQALSVTLRGQATGDIKDQSLVRSVFKEAGVGLTNGILIGAAIGLITLLWQSDMILGGIIFVSMALTVLVSTIAGIVVPVTLEKLGYDPAMASSIFVTAIADITGIMFLLGTAAVYLGYF